MKKLAITALVLAFAGTALAQSNTDMPYLYPDKCKSQKSIVVPESVEGTSYFFNRDCSIAYIVPPPTASLEIANAALSMNLGLCPAVEKNQAIIIQIYNQIAETLSKMADLTPDDPRLPKYREHHDKLREMVVQAENNFAKVHGMTVQMQFNGSLTPDYMKSVVIANMPSIESGNIKIRQAPLGKSYLSFNSVIPGLTKTYASNPVLESNILGILSQADENNMDRTSIRFNGSAQGYASLNLIASCSLVSGDFTKVNSLKLKPEGAASYLTATNTMMVPLIATFGYKAKLDVKNATDTVFNKFGHNGKFSSTEVTNLFLDGAASETITVESWTQENLDGLQETTYQDAISIENQQKVKELLMARYLEKLVQFKALSAIDEIQTPQAGTETQTGVRQQCWSSSSFFGLFRSGGCRNVSFQFLVDVDGQSRQTAEITNHLNAEFTDEATFLHPTTRVFTSAFKLKGQ